MKMGVGHRTAGRVIGLLLVDLVALACASAPGPRDGRQIVKNEQPRGTTVPAASEGPAGRVETKLGECPANPDACEETVAVNRVKALDEAKVSCRRGERASCGFLYRSGPEGLARLQGEAGPLRWFVGRTEVPGKGSWQANAVKVTLFDGAPLFLVDRKGATAMVSFPQVHFVAGNSRVPDIWFEVPIARLSLMPRPLHLAPSGGRQAMGFERALAPAPGEQDYVKTDCGPLSIIEEKQQAGKRFQRIAQVIEGVEITGWTAIPIDFDLGPCFPEGALLFASDGKPGPGTVALDEEKVARALTEVWRTGFTFYEYPGDGAACVRRTVEGEHAVSEWTSADRRDSWRVERYGIHLIFLGPAVESRSGKTSAYNGATLYSALEITEDAIVISGGAERGERVVAYRPALTRRWWRTKEGCEQDRRQHPRLHNAD